ncbi:bifunctional 2-polyprenyl-6-hydroxyphenol methylase/3-demethylubiquinol 3-O-methyltransferase UbiG [Cognatishimia sp. F0-27]|uniref:class I SAM-dependent methyltransferase n=1 Tax=Cognatishimia sp. F0-27 TaxID=2816855 RepID=UPI001D0C9DF3|nr:class I SAM-dependent methyltransferase [Cognatishimia sp. F0-27]MCC1494884.1 methyltransferase domain-containing protein [Cognatishimia sp. F0-27]
MPDAATFWDKIAEKYARDPIGDLAGYHETRDRIAARLKPDHRVLELGCGTGSTALELAEGVADYLATDISPKMIEIARSKQADQTGGALDHLRFAVSEADGSTVSESRADVILALNLLHLVPDAETSLRTIHDTLPKDGLLISKTACLGEAPWYVRFAIPLMRLVGKAPFVRSFSSEELVTMIEAQGFVIEDRLDQSGMAPRLFVVARKG